VLGDGSDQEALEAVHGPGTPVMAVRQWLSAIFDRSGWTEAWETSDPTFRLCRAQAWLWNNKAHPHLARLDLGALAQAWAAGDPRDPEMWRSFAAIEVAAYRRAWGSLGNPAAWGAAAQPLPMSPDTEVVLLFPTVTEATVLTAATTVAAVHFLVRLSDRWRVLNAGRPNPPRPGWPPVLG
jgi:hypothetical protein